MAKVLPVKEKLQSNLILGGEFISTIHQGTYDTVGPAYNALTAWAKANNYKPTGIAYEYYLNDPGADPAIVAKAEIHFLLKQEKERGS